MFHPALRFPVVKNEQNLYDALYWEINIKRWDFNVYNLIRVA